MSIGVRPVIEKWGYTVDLAASGVDAARLLRRALAHFDDHLETEQHDYADMVVVWCDDGEKACRLLFEMSDDDIWVIADGEEGDIGILNVYRDSASLWSSHLDDGELRLYFDDF